MQIWLGPGDKDDDGDDHIRQDRSLSMSIAPTSRYRSMLYLHGIMNFAAPGFIFHKMRRYALASM